MYPFDNEEERRRRLLTPPFVPAAGNPAGMPAPPYQPDDMAPPSRYQRIEAEKQGYLRGTPGRGKSAATGALEGFAQGGLRGAVIGGLTGAISPRRLREQRFEQYQRPKIEERFAYEDSDRLMQMQEANQRRQQAMDVLRANEAQADINLKNAQAERALRPEPVKQTPAEWKLGRNLKSGQYRWYNAADPLQAAEHEAHVTQPTETPVFRVDASGNYVDVRKAAKEGKPVKAFQRPRVGRQPKEAAKYVSHSQIMQYAQENNMSSSDAAAAFKNKGYRVTR